MTKERYNPPPGPPPGWSKKQEAASDSYAPPPGPPPGYQRHDEKSGMSEQYAPPPGPPPSHRQEDPLDQSAPPDYAPWLSVPDTSLLPPAPAVTHDTSPTANATEYSAEQAKEWCNRFQLYQPGQIPASVHEDFRLHGFTFTPPSPHFSGELKRAMRQHNSWSVRTRKNCGDCILTTSAPLYSAALNDPLRNQGRPFTIYFEIRVMRMGSDSGDEGDAGIAIGFVAPPYPTFRLPGWERGSFGVHGDDGRRYIDDDGGGQDFTTYFKNGETVGIGMHIRPAQFPGRRRDVEVFFTREGQKEGGWNMYEERDGDDCGSIVGLEGDHDLMAAVGMFGQVEFEVRFRREEWLYRA
ncbi:hypothetical protein E4T44_02360 [Aureobasidium sp. EXF-8845]|nr:hypothetical protein E4T45_07384 [Aureobasidium sp. EXF-8846]KAI4851076.1 hypothetical protein E4T44_02360 [Aureobasidium sp. EXF-8845]